MKLSCLIVDDEPLARKGLMEHAMAAGFMDLKGECESAAAAQKILAEQKIDLVFLDIQMPKLTGIEFLKSLRSQPMVIFTTAYSEYALQGYELNVLDYLVKPISLARFLTAANKAREFYELKNSAMGNKGRGEDYFFIRCENGYEKIMHEDLLFASAQQNYVMLQTRTRKYISYITFKEVEEYLPANKFIKVHKSFIVGIPHIDKINGNEIMIGPHVIPISRNLKDEVMRRVVGDKLMKRKN